MELVLASLASLGLPRVMPALVTVVERECRSHSGRLSAAVDSGVALGHEPKEPGMEDSIAWPMRCPP